MLFIPFILYSLVWIATIILYNLIPISQLYPNLQGELLIFLIFTIIFNIFISFILKKNEIKNFSILDKKYGIIYIIIYSYFILEFFYVGKIPLIEALLKTGYSYLSFKGIKTFHVIFYTFNFYITLCVFYQHLIEKKMKYIIYVFLGCFIYILLYSRGAILLQVACYSIVYLLKNMMEKNYKILKLGVIGIIILYLFGVSGNIRHYYKWNDTSMIKEIAQIKTKESILDPFIWSYVYITSPLGNLQYNFNNIKPTNDKKYFIYENLLPDTISKRLDYNKINSKLMIENLTVSTMYIDSYLSYGKLGMWITFLVYMLCEIGYLLFLNRTKYYIVGLSLVSILNIFSIFDNMFVFSGLSFCLVYPLIDIFIDKIKNKSEVE